MVSLPDISVLVDRFKEGDTVLNVLDMRAIVLIIEVFGKNYEEITEKMLYINKTLHFYDENMNDMLIHIMPDFEHW